MYVSRDLPIGNWFGCMWLPALGSCPMEKRLAGACCEKDSWLLWLPELRSKVCMRPDTSAGRVPDRTGPE